MAHLMVCVGMEGFQVNSRVVPIGEYLESYDPDFRGGIGKASWTKDASKAKRFPDFASAIGEWKRQSTVRPLRGDGRPNRPLTAYTVTFRVVD